MSSTVRAPHVLVRYKTLGRGQIAQPLLDYTTQFAPRAALLIVRGGKLSTSEADAGLADLVIDAANGVQIGRGGRA
jgi:hypothetical protein